MTDTDADRLLLPEPACPDCGQVDPIDAITAVVPGLCHSCIADRITVGREEPALPDAPHSLNGP